ncbi:hypothetical protein [Armatimonas sp.]|uniref:hypothetical protein n=1 Tax=Armatimonas sp. TaxID=1872638 RepID=UPI003753B97E
MKFVSSLVISLSALSTGSIALGQTVTYQNNQTVTGAVGNVYKSDQSSHSQNDQGHNASISGKIRANLYFFGNDIVPLYISYLIHTSTFSSNGSNFSTIGGMLDTSIDDLFVDSPDPGLNFPAGSTTGGVGFSFNIELRGVNISRQGQTWQTSDGVLHGNTIYSYGTDHHNMLGDYFSLDTPNWQDFNGDIFGTWFYVGSSTSWSPAYSGANSIWNTIKMPIAGMRRYTIDSFSPPKWIGIPNLVTEFPVIYTHQDTYGPAKAKYILHVHEIYDDITSAGFTTEEIVEPSTGGNPLTGAYDGTGKTHSVTIHKGGDWSFSGGFPIGWAGFDIGMTQGAPEENVSVNDPTLAEGARAVLLLRKITYHKNFDFRQYNAEGEILANPSDPTSKHQLSASRPDGETPQWYYFYDNEDWRQKFLGGGGLGGIWG